MKVSARVPVDATSDMLNQRHQLVSVVGSRQSSQAGVSQALGHLPAPHDGGTPTSALLPAAQPLHPSMQRGTAGTQQAVGLLPLRPRGAGQPDGGVGTEGVHPAAGQGTAAPPAGFPPSPTHSQAPPPWPQLSCASLSAWHQPGHPPDTAMQKPAAQAQARGLAGDSAAQAAFSFALPQGHLPGGPPQWWIQQWVQLPVFGAMQWQPPASRQAWYPVAGSLGQAWSGLPSAGVPPGAAAHGSPAGPLAHRVAAGTSLRQQGDATPRTPGRQQQDWAGAAGLLPVGDHCVPHDTHKSGSSDPSCPANNGVAVGPVPARPRGYPGPQAPVQQRAVQLDSTLQHEAAGPSRASAERALSLQEVPVALRQAGQDQSVAGAARQQLRHSSSLGDLQGAMATTAAGNAAGAPQASCESTLHCALAGLGRHGSPAEHSHTMGPLPQTGGRSGADMCLHGAGSSDLEAAAQDLHQQSQHRKVAGAAAAVELQPREVAFNIPVAETLLHNVTTSPGPAVEQGAGRGLPAAGQAASQDQEQLARAKLHPGWWQQLAAAGVAAPSPRGVRPGQPSLGRGQPVGPPPGRGAGQLNDPVGIRADAPVSHAPQAALPSRQSLAPASQAAHWAGQPATLQAPGRVSQAGGVLLQQPEEGGASEASSLAEVQSTLATAPGRLQAQMSSLLRRKSAAEVLPHQGATEVLPEEGGLGATAAVAGADVEAALVGPLWQSLPKEPVEQTWGELHSWWRLKAVGDRACDEHGWPAVGVSLLHFTHCHAPHKTQVWRRAHHFDGHRVVDVLCLAR